LREHLEGSRVGGEFSQVSQHLMNGLILAIILLRGCIIDIELGLTKVCTFSWRLFIVFGMLLVIVIFFSTNGLQTN
jgi:hypothetical protein